MTTFQNQRPDGTLFDDLEKGEVTGDKNEYEGGSGFLDQLTPPPEGVHDSEEQASQHALPPQKPNPTDWNGPDDPDNPHNWGTWKRVYHATIPALFGFAV